MKRTDGVGGILNQAARWRRDIGRLISLLRLVVRTRQGLIADSPDQDGPTLRSIVGLVSFLGLTAETRSQLVSSQSELTRFESAEKYRRSGRDSEPGRPMATRYRAADQFAPIRCKLGRSNLGHTQRGGHTAHPFVYARQDSNL